MTTNRTHRASRSIDWTPDRIKYLRTQYRDTQHEFARRLDVSLNVPSLWETGASQPQPRLLRRLDRLAARIGYHPEGE